MKTQTKPEIKITKVKKLKHLRALQPGATVVLNGHLAVLRDSHEIVPDGNSRSYSFVFPGIEPKGYIPHLDFSDMDESQVSFSSKGYIRAARHDAPIQASPAISYSQASRLHIRSTRILTQAGLLEAQL